MRDDVSFDQGVVIEEEEVICLGCFRHELNKLWCCIVLIKGCIPLPLISIKRIFLKDSWLLASSHTPSM